MYTYSAMAKNFMEKLASPIVRFGIQNVIYR